MEFCMRNTIFQGFHTKFSAKLRALQGFFREKKKVFKKITAYTGLFQDFQA